MAEHNDKHVKVKKRRSLRETFSHNWGLKVLSVLFAILLWSYVVSETNPVRSITYNQVSISVTGLSELMGQRMVPLEALNVKLPTIKVSLNVPYSELSGVSETSIEASVDLSKITTTGPAVLPIKVKSNSADIIVTSYHPMTVEVYIEELTSAVVPVNIRTSGTLPSDLYKGTVITDPSTIAISGPASYVSRITQAQIKVDLSAMTDSYIASLQYEFVDGSGNTVSSDNITVDNDVILVDMGILSKKTVPIEYLSRLKNTDKLALGYELKSAEAEHPTLTIIGREQVLASIDKLYISDIDMQNMGPETTALEAEVIIPDGVTLLEQSQQQISIVIAEKNIERVFEIPIDYINNAGKKVSAVVKTARVTINGTYSTVNSITRNDIDVFTDTTALDEGTHTVRLTVKLKQPNPYITIDVEPVEVSVVLSK